MAEEHSDGGLTALIMNCTYTILAGQRTVTISSKGKPPKGFPRGELLSVGANGAKNYAVDPIKVLTWARDRIQAACDAARAEKTIPSQDTTP